MCVWSNKVLKVKARTNAEEGMKRRWQSEFWKGVRSRRTFPRFLKVHHHPKLPKGLGASIALSSLAMACHHCLDCVWTLQAASGAGTHHNHTPTETTPVTSDQGSKSNCPRVLLLAHPLPSAKKTLRSHAPSLRGN